MADTHEQEETQAIVALLGGKKVFRQEITDPYEMLEIVRKGLPFRAFEALLSVIELQLNQLSLLIGVPPRTLARRRTAKQFNPLESDRLYRIAHVLGIAKHTLGSLEKARVWLGRPNRSLDGAKPLSLLDTDIGVRQVEDVLARISYGVYG